MSRLPSSKTLVLLGSVALGIIVACGSDDGGSKFKGDAVDGGTPPPMLPPSFGGDSGGNQGPWSDFPKDPIVATSDGGGELTPANAAELFAASPSGPAGDGNDPCLVEPEIGSIVPKNWLRPRFRYVAAGEQNIFEIRLRAANQTNDLVVYTTSKTWEMPASLWQAFRNHSADVGITISVRGGKLANGAVTGVTQGSSGAWAIAPVEAPGSIVYWRIKGGDIADLKGFAVGDDTVRPTLDPAKVEVKADLKCVGCHTSSPDGKYAIFSSNGLSNYGTGIASIEPATEGKKPPYLTALGESSLETYLKGITTVAAPLWTETKHIVVASGGGELRWVNLDGTTPENVKGVIARNGDARTAPVAPNLSHDGTRIVYVSGNSATDGRPGGNENDIYVVPYGDGAGGAATAVAGAATAENEFFPSFSPDDKLVAFSRTPKEGDSYAEPKAEVMVVASGGGEAQRLAANDPPACTGTKSPGVENSWPKWAPAKPSPETVNGKTYYWLVFSSTRSGGGRRQLYMAPVVVENGKVLPYKAVYLWNQPDQENNHTPAWDVFAIPPSGPK